MKYKTQLIRHSTSGMVILKIIDSSVSPEIEVKSKDFDLTKPVSGANLSDLFFTNVNYQEGFVLEDCIVVEEKNNNEKLFFDLINDFILKLNAKFPALNEIK